MPNKASYARLSFPPCSRSLIQQRRRIRGRSFSVVFVLLAICLSLSSQQSFFGVDSVGAADTSYVYDSLGRLVTDDASGDAAAYKYDAVGNLLSVTNYPSSQLAGVGVSSDSGTTGSSFTIYGTDFCSSPTVTINGANASVSSSSSTQIVVVIPTGATTGAVDVTCGTNEVDIGNFTVTPITAPSIAGFTPTIGPSGTSVTISGTNFQTNPEDNNVGFNTAPPANISSATSTSITAIVPASATSGHISVSTPFGNAVSTGDFYVPPAGVSPSNVVTGQITANGPTVTSTITTAGTTAMYTFDATSGEQINLNITNTSFSGSGEIDISIGAPNGSAVGSIRTGGPNALIPDVTLLTTGTYTVVVSPEGSNIGSVTLQLFNLTGGNLGVRGDFSNGYVSGTSISEFLPATIQPGDLTVVGIGSLSAAASFTPPSGWTTLLNAAGNGVFYKIFQTGDSTTIAFTSSQSTYITAQGITYIGADQTAPIDSFNSWVFQSSGPPYPGYSRAPTLNPSYKGDQLLCGFMGDSWDSALFSIPAGLTLQGYIAPGPNIEFADMPLVDGTATGNFDATGGLAGTPISARAGFQLALKVAGSSAATPQPATPSIGGEMALGYVRANAAISLNLSSLSVQNNDLVIVAFVPDGSTSLSAPSGYTTIETPLGNAAIFQHVWHAGDSETPSFSFSGSSGWVVPFVWVIRGAGTGNAPQIDQHGFNYSANASSLGVPSLTPTTNYDLLLLLFGNAYDPGGSWPIVPAGPAFDVKYGGGPNLLAGSLVLSNEDATSGYTAGFSASSQMWAFAIAVKMP